MKHWRWRAPSPALLVACAALFVALGGTVLAATKIDGRTIRVKSLPGDRLAVGSLPGNRLRPGTIPGSRLAPGSVKGAQIDVDTLGQVPSATHADSAETAHHAQTATAADQAANATTINGRAVGCPEMTREFAGACWDLQPSTTALSATDAAAACAKAGGELPDALAFLAFAGQPGVRIALDGEWLNEIWIYSEPVYSVYLISSDAKFHLRLPAEPHSFRCVTPLVS